MSLDTLNDLSYEAEVIALEVPFEHTDVTESMLATEGLRQLLVVTEAEQYAHGLPMSTFERALAWTALREADHYAEHDDPCDVAQHEVAANVEYAKQLLGYGALKGLAADKAAHVGVDPQLWEKTVQLLEYMQRYDYGQADHEKLVLAHCLRVAISVADLAPVLSVPADKLFIAAATHDPLKLLYPNNSRDSETGAPWVGDRPVIMDKHSKNAFVLLTALGFGETIARVNGQHHANQPHRPIDNGISLTVTERKIRNLLACADSYDAMKNRTNSRNKHMTPDDKDTWLLGDFEYKLREEFAEATVRHGVARELLTRLDVTSQLFRRIPETAQ